MKNSHSIAAIAVGIVVVGFIGWYIGTKTAEAPATLTVDSQSEVASTTDNVASSTLTDTEAVTTPTPIPTPAAAPKVVSAPKPSAPVKTQPTASIKLVTYNGKGFSPREITIIKGDTVRFLNTSDEKMWIVSDLPHTHNAYPIKTENGCSPTIFDQCASVGNGKYWDFKFDREGTFGYHNESKPVMNGKVEVNLRSDKPATSGDY